MQPATATGPRTAEGKQKSSQNATKHGCCSHQLVLPDEDPAGWEALKAGWLQEYEALNHAALSLILQAAEAQWMLVRAHNHFSQTQYAIYQEQPECTLWTEAHHKLYQKFQRYLTAAQNTFQRAFQAIERLRRNVLKQHDVAFRQNLALSRFEITQERAALQTMLVQAKVDYYESKTIPARAKFNTPTTSYPHPPERS
jgi:hypothetical protein